jgi:hypothetical protein
MEGDMMQMGRFDDIPRTRNGEDDDFAEVP